MSRKRRKSPPPSEAEREPPAPAPGPGAFRLWGGVLALGTSSAAAIALSARHLGLGALPGCGLESACDRAIASEWGSLPILDWPVAHLGTAHFLGLLGAWWVTGGRWPRGLRWWARLGGGVSLAYLAVLVSMGEPCPYCLTAHLGNLAFLVLFERATALAAAHGRPGLRGYAALALSSTLVLAGFEARGRAHDERDLNETVQSAAAGEQDTFGGRHRLGPEDARVRIVIFSDFQCPDCRQIDEEALRLVEERDDVSLSIRHFPLSTDCNPRARELGHNPHPNACWAARAAEAADLLGGTEGYWRMSHWLFERKGAFDPPTLEAAVAELGFDPATFLGLVRGPQTQQRVLEDIDQALSVGLATTPMVFLNGVELRAWDRKDALRRAVELVARAGASTSAAGDRPPGALEKCLEDWRQQPRLELPVAGRGVDPPGDGPLLVVYGDYLDPTTQELDRRVRALCREHPVLRYSYRHFPLDPACVRGVPDSHPGACRVARALEAAFRVGGAAAAERLHEPLFGIRPEVAALVEAARAAGLDVERFRAELESGATLDAVRADAGGAQRMGVHTIPALFVAGRYAPRWRFGDEPVLERIVEEALQAR